MFAATESQSRHFAGLSPAAWVACAFGLLFVAGTAFLLFRSWRVEASLKAMTQSERVSLAGGVDLAGFSASVAAILGGPGVVALHFRARELWRKQVASVSLEALLAFIDAKLDEPKKDPTRLERLLHKVKGWLVDRTDPAGLPALGWRLLRDLREPVLSGNVVCGFDDPALTGKAAAWLFPIAGVLSPLGPFDVAIDWSGKNRIDGAFEMGVRFVPARVGIAFASFARAHIRLIK